MSAVDDLALLTELEPLAAQLLDRHLSAAKPWSPHELVPWSRAGDFPEVGTPEGEVDIDPALRSALFVNLLTEDNLPYYFRDIERMFGRDGAFGEWVRRWTAEEGRHGIVIRDYITVSRLIDPAVLEDARMAQVCGGEVPEPAGAAEGFVYVALQELATRISHRNTAKALDDPIGYEVLAKVAADENRHYVFYRDMASAAIELDPSRLMLAIEAEVRNFEMPGTGIPNFKSHAAAISRAGIYDIAIHYDQILVPVVLQRWDVANLTGLSDEAERARDALMERLERFAKIAERTKSRREEQLELATV